MKFFTPLVFTALLLFSVSAFSTPTANGNIIGFWRTEDSSSIVEINPCDPFLCGKIIWLKEPNDKKGIPWTDSFNPDPKLRSRAIMGLTILMGLKEGENGRWKNGTIYDPNSGSTYSCHVKLKDSDHLVFRGYVLNPLFGRSETWRRIKPTGNPLSDDLASEE